jgi:hypothetical protein
MNPENPYHVLFPKGIQLLTIVGDEGITETATVCALAVIKKQQANSTTVNFKKWFCSFWHILSIIIGIPFSG